MAHRTSVSWFGTPLLKRYEMPGPLRNLFCASPVGLPWLVRRMFVPDLHAVRARDVRQREAFLVLPAWHRPRSRRRAVAQIESLVGDANDPVASLLVAAQTTGARVVLIKVLRRHARFDEDPVAERVGPRERGVVVGIVVMLTRRFRRRPAARQQVEHAIAVRLERARERELVLLRRLPRHAGAVILRIVVGRCRTAQVRVVEIRLRLLRLVPVDAIGELLRDAFARGDEEPELVALDRAAKPFTGVAELLQRADAVRIQVTREQFRRDVASRPASDPNTPRSRCPRTGCRRLSGSC